jgi:hypothetical protein
MIIWINGAFGSGKSNVAEAVNKLIPKSFVYDPEQVGYFLWHVFPDEMKRKGNFQHIPIWREFNYKILKHISSTYDGVIIVPMTIYIRQYYDEIATALENDGIMVKHFILSATKQTIINRLVGRGDPADGWAAQHIDRCINAFATDISGEMIDTEENDIDKCAFNIVKIASITK